MVAAVDQLSTFVPSPIMARLDDEDGALIALRAANGAGKTMHMARMVALRALANPGSLHRVVGPSHDQVRNVIGRYLWQLLKPYVAPGSMWREGVGWNGFNTAVLNNGAAIQLKAYKDDPDTHEGRHDLMTIALDEVPTKAHFQANKGRAAMLILGFTVQTKAPPLWLRREIEGKDESPSSGRTVHSTGWVQYVIPFTRENVPWYTDQEYNLKAGKWLGTEFEATRIRAQWEAASETRRFTGWASALVRSTGEILHALRDPVTKRPRIDRARYGISYGVGDEQYQTLILQKGDTFYMVAEYVGGPRDRMFDHARALQSAVDGWLLRGHRGLNILAANDGGVYGDILDAGPGGGGDRMNDRMTASLRQVYGVTSLPFEVAAPDRATSDKGARELGINHAMLEGRWFVCDECEAAIRAFQQYEGDPSDPQRIPVMAASYAVQDLILAGAPNTDASPTLHR